MPGQERDDISERCRQPPAPTLRHGKGAAQQPEEQRQPDRRAQDGQLERRIARQIAGEGEDAARQQGGRAVAEQIPRQQIGEAAGQRDVDDGLDLQPIESRGGRAPGERQHQQQIAEGIKDRGLHIGQEGMAREGVRIPERQSSRQQLHALKQAEGQEMVGEIARREAAQTQQQGHVEDSGQRTKAEKRSHIWGTQQPGEMEPDPSHGTIIPQGSTAVSLTDAPK